MAAHTSMEYEIKIPVASLDKLRRRLADRGWNRLCAATREVNILLDTPDSALRHAQQALRLRRFGDQQTITFKGPPSAAGVVKAREELEMAVADMDLGLAILERLGFTPSMRYEKDRELWQLGTITVALDHTPLGDFVEVEGPEEELLCTAEELGLDPDRAVTEPYPALWREHRKGHAQLPRDMVFPS